MGEQRVEIEVAKRRANNAENELVEFKKNNYSQNL